MAERQATQGPGMGGTDWEAASPAGGDGMAELKARIRANTRSVLFQESTDPRAFDVAAYAFSFGFCDSDEKQLAYRAMKAAWAWGMASMPRPSDWPAMFRRRRRPRPNKAV